MGFDMKIISLQAENFKRLKAIDITPEGNTVVIAGRNGQGKTSVLDAIWLALGGGGAAKESETIRPIRAGENRASVTVDLGDIKVTRSWSEKGSTLKVEGRDGAVFKSPQALLDGMIGRLSFDPLAFSRMSPAEQRKTLISLVDLGFDPDLMETERKRLYDERTDINRDLKSMEARRDALPTSDPDTPAEEVSLKDLLAEAQAAVTEKAENDKLRAELVSKRETLAALKSDIAELRRQLSLKEEQLHDLIVDGQCLKVQVESLIDPDIEAINRKIADIESINARALNVKERRALEKQVEEMKDSSDERTKRIEELDEMKRYALAAAKFPVAGLGFDEDGVMFGGIPFAQCSAAERMKVSLAMAAALNPKIRVIRVNDGSLLDSESMAEVERMAVEHDMQVWIERVDESGKVGILIEDGEVAITGGGEAAA